MEHSGKGETSRSSAVQFPLRLTAGQHSAEQEQGGLQQKWAGLLLRPHPAAKPQGLFCQVTGLNLQLFDFANVFFKI